MGVLPGGVGWWEGLVFCWGLGLRDFESELRRLVRH